MKNSRATLYRVPLLFCTLALGGVSLWAQSSTTTSGPAASANGTIANQDELLKSTEAYLRKLYAWGPDFKVKLGPVTQSMAQDFVRVAVEITYEGHSDGGEVFVSKDGREMIRGDMFNMEKDPYAETRAHLHLEGSPSMGPADASVTIVEFSDFQCPHCKEFHEALGPIQQKFPQIKFVYKDFPLTEIHPWAESAAIGARCAFEQSQAAFWKMHDQIFAGQDLISPENIWDKLKEFASQDGLDNAAFSACLSSDEAKKAVEANHAQGVELGINSTPTIYVNGRPIEGGDPALVTQYIQYELDTHGK